MALKLVEAAMVVALLAIATNMRASGQTAVDGAVRGVVEDAGGAAIRGVAVRVEDEATGFVARAATDGSGEFLVGRVPASTYRVTLEAAGFEQMVLPGVVVELGTVTAVDARLQVAGVTTAVTVTAGGVDSEATAIGSTIAADEIQRLPVDGRRWQTFAQVTPEVNSDAAGLLSFRGIAVTQNSTVVD